MLDNAQNPADSLLQVRGLSVVHNSSKGPVTILSNVDIDLGRGETLGIVGESGSGKSIMSKAVAGLLPPRSRRVRGKYRLRRDLIARS